MANILEEQFNELIKNADTEEDKEMFKALKVLAKYYKADRISKSVDHHVDGTYDLTIVFEDIPYFYRK